MTYGYQRSVDIAMGVRYKRPDGTYQNKPEFLAQANMKVFELSKAVVEDGFAEG